MDIEAGLIPIVQAQFPTATVRTSTSNELADELPTIKLLDTGGSGDTYGMDAQGVEVDIFHNSKDNAATLAWQVYRWLMRSLPPVIDGVGVRSVADGSLPIETSYENPAVWRYTFNIRISTHDRSS